MESKNSVLTRAELAQISGEAGTEKELIIAVFVLTSLLSDLCSLCSYNLILLPWDDEKCVHFLTAGICVINFTTVLFVCLYVLLVRHDI